MEYLGTIDNKTILYTHLLTDENWIENLPHNSWTLFTVGDPEEIEFAPEIVSHSMDRNVCCICISGKIAEKVDQYFLGEIYESLTLINGGNEPSEEDILNGVHSVPHEKICDGFWFAVFCGFKLNECIDTVVCIDFTTKGIKNYLLELMENFDNDWNPSEEEPETFEYDYVFIGPSEKFPSGHYMLR